MFSTSFLNNEIDFSLTSQGDPSASGTLGGTVAEKLVLDSIPPVHCRPNTIFILLQLTQQLTEHDPLLVDDTAD